MKETGNRLLHLNLDIFRDSPEEVQKRNYDGLTAFIFIGMAVSLFAWLLSGIITGNLLSSNITIFLIFYIILMPMYMVTVKRWNGKHSLLMMYIIVAIALLTSILSGTVLDPDTPAFTYMVVVIAAPPLIFDNPVHILSFSYLSSAVFAILSMYTKTPELFAMDMSHLISASALSTGLTLIILDVRIAAAESALEIKSLSEHDPLTGLMNRRGGEKMISTLMEQDNHGTLAFIDVDLFKNINDSFGHIAGDAALSEVADTMRKCFRKDDILIRAGGDEFILYFPGLTDEKTISDIMDRYATAVRELNIEECPGHTVTQSIGVIINDGDIEAYEDLYRMADQEMYQVKTAGRNSCRIVSTGSLVHNV